MFGCLAGHLQRMPKGCCATKLSGREMTLIPMVMVFVLGRQVPNTVR
jgi:hypothetical protein